MGILPANISIKKIVNIFFTFYGRIGEGGFISGQLRIRLSQVVPGTELQRTLRNGIPPDRKFRKVGNRYSNLNFFTWYRSVS